MSQLTTPPATPNTILLRIDSLGEKYLEGRVAAAKTVTPGMLVERTTDASNNPDGVWQPHSTAGGYAEPIVAVELALVADVPKQTYSGGTIDDVYNAGDLLRMHECQPGDELYMFLPASASAVVLTDFLTSNGDGTLKKASSTDVRGWKPLEAVDNSANAASKARIRVRRL